MIESYLLGFITGFIISLGLCLLPEMIRKCKSKDDFIDITRR